MIVMTLLLHHHHQYLTKQNILVVVVAQNDPIRQEKVKSISESRAARALENRSI